MKRRILPSILATLAILIGQIDLQAQQEQMYTQFMFNKLAINPAFAGNEKYLGLTGLYRDQWNGFPGAPQSQIFSVNLPKIGEKIGVGFNFKRQTIGIHTNINYSGIYSYKFPTQAGTFSMGIEFGGQNIRSDFSDPRLTAIEGIENDPSIPKINTNINALNVGYGVYFNSNSFYVGASIPKLIRTDLDFDNNNRISEQVRHLFVMGGVAFPVARDLSMSVQSLLKFAENSPFDTDLNVSLTVDEKYTGGINYRLGGANGDFGESIALLAAFQINEQMMIGLTQEFTLSKIRRFDNNSIELVLHYGIGKKKSKVVLINPRYF